MESAGVQLTDEVIEAINEELAYTEQLPDVGRADTLDHGVEGQILTLQEYASKARSDWVGNDGNEEALHQLRKCAAIAVRALVKYGCPRRGTP